MVYTIAKGDEEDAIYNKLSLSTNLNLAAVKLKLEEFRDVISYAYQVRTKIISSKLTFIPLGLKNRT